MSRLFYLFLFLFGCCFSFVANGQSVSLTTSKSTVEVGEAFTATATISGLEDDEEVVAYEWNVIDLGTGGKLNGGTTNPLNVPSSSTTNQVNIELGIPIFQQFSSPQQVGIEVKVTYVGPGGPGEIPRTGSVNLRVICPPTLSGPSDIQRCCIDQVTFCATNVCAGNLYSWTDIPSGWQVVGPTNQSCIDLIPDNNSGGQLKVEVRRQESISNYKEEGTVNITRSAISIREGVSFPKVNLCPGEIRTYELASGPVCNLDGYQWSFPAGWNLLSGQGTSSVTVQLTASAVSGNVVVTATAGGGACTDQLIVPVSVITAPPAVPVIYEGQFPAYSSEFHCGEWRMCNGEGEIRLFDFDQNFASGTQQLEWTVTAPWTFAGGVNTMITGPQWASPTIYGPTFAPDGTLCVRAINCIGASLFACISFEWSNDYWCQSENIYPEWCECCAPPCDGCPNYQLNQGHPTDFMESPIHEELDGELPGNVELTIFPNPTNGVIHLQRSDARAITGQVRIHTLQGVEVFRGAASSSLDLSGLPAGVYRVQLQTDFGRFSELLIVE